MNLIIRPVAAGDIEAAYRWYRGKGDDLGLEFLGALRVAITRVLENPRAYPVLIRETRRVRLKRFPYGLFYRVYSDTVVVVACMHGKRDPRKWQSRRDG